MIPHSSIPWEANEANHVIMYDNVSDISKRAYFYSEPPPPPDSSGMSAGPGTSLFLQPCMALESCKGRCS